MDRTGLTLTVVASLTAIVVGMVVLSTVAGIGLSGDLLSTDDGGPGDGPASTPVDDGNASSETNGSVNDSTEETPEITEEAARIAAPEPGDPYFEASDPEAGWISYINPRDEYRDPYLGPGSGKLCVTLLNQSGEPIVGESIPDTRVTIPTGENLSWHSGADPFVVEFPVTDYERQPLDADQFGTSPDLPQGDGYMDSHCIEFHGLPVNGTISYGEAEVEGEYAEHVEVVGYIQQSGQAWNTDIDPVSAAVPYAEAGGGWTYESDASHGQAVIVLQLDPSTTDE